MLTNCYCTLTELGRALGLDKQRQNQEKEKLETAITHASRYIDFMTKRFFYKKSLTAELIDVYQPSDNGIRMYDTDMLFPVPIISVTSLIENGTALTVNIDYWVYNALIQKKYAFSNERKAISFTGDIGYITTPAHINAFCIQLAEIFSKIGTRIISDEGGFSNSLSAYIPVWLRDSIRAEAVNHV